MKKKMLLLAILGALMLFLFSGCMYYKMETAINANGSGTLVLTTGYEESYYQEMISIGSLTKEEFELFKTQTTKVTQDGKVYYCVTEKTNFSNTRKLEKILAENGYITYASKDTFFMTAGEATEETMGDTSEMGEEEVKDIINMEITVTFDSPICKNSGGILSNDNKTITWDINYLMKNEDLYATTTTKTQKAAAVNVAKNKIYKKPQTLKVKSGTGTVYMDDTVVTSGKTKAKNGEHTLLIMNQNGTKKSFSFTVDTKAPTIKGIKNNKTYKKNVKLTFSDDVSGIKKVTVNGKKISNKAVKNGYTVKKNGKYTVKATDKAGNVKTMKFTIKK